MKFKIAALLVGSCLASSQAGAQANVIIVNDRPWRCSGQICSGFPGESRFDVQLSCRDIAQKVGAVTGFESAKGAISADNLVRCNMYARFTRRAQGFGIER